MNKLFLLNNGIVYRLWSEDNRTTDCVVIPEVLRDPLLMLAHNYSGHNGFRRTYNAMKRQYYWPGMRKDILRHCKKCHQCALQNQGTGEVGFDHFNVPSLPMEFICMDLVGPISPQTSKGNRYMLTVIDMLTGYTVAVPIMDKCSETVCKAYRDSVYCIFGGSSRILTDNGTEFRNKEMKEICKELDIKQVFSPVYTPQANGRLEGWHRFLKACIAKHIRGADVEWDDLIPLAVSAYNFFPCQSSKEAPFVLMFGRDPITPIAKLLEPKLKFYGEKGVGINMNTLRKLYTVVAENIRRAREKQPRQETSPTKLRVNDLVLVKDPESAAFDPKYVPNYRITAAYGRNRIEVQDEKGNKSVRRAAHVKVCEPVDKVISQLPPQAVYEQYGRASKLIIHPKDVPEIPLQLFNGQRQGEMSEDTEMTDDVLVDVLDESKSLEKTFNDEIKPSTYIDESRSREQDVMEGEAQFEQCEVNTLSIDGEYKTVTVLDACDESKPRPQIPMMYEARETEVISDEIDESTRQTVKPVCLGNNNSDESRSRDCQPGVGAKCSQVPMNGMQVQNSTQQTDTSVGSDESSSRPNRCLVSMHEQSEQLVTSAIQSGCVESTRVNMHDIDKCLATNKCECCKQDSNQMRNKWLSSTFSMLTSSVWGKSKNTTGEAVIENVSTNSKNIIFKPEFNFFL